MTVVKTPELFRFYPRKKLTELVHDSMKAEDVVILCYDYLSYLNSMYSDIKAIQSATTDEKFHDQLSDQIRKNGEWRAFLRNIIAWFRESPRSDRLAKVFLDHAASIDHTINKYHLAIREWESAVWEGRDKPGRFERERHELPQHEGRQQHHNDRRQHWGQQYRRAQRYQDGRERRYQQQQRGVGHSQHDNREIPGGHRRNQRNRACGLEAWGFRTWPTWDDLRQKLDRVGVRRRCSSVRPVPRYDHTPKDSSN